MIDEVTRIRLDDHSKRLGDHDVRIAVAEQQVKSIGEDVHELRDEFRSLKRALYTAAISTASGVAIFAFTAFSIWGK